MEPDGGLAFTPYSKMIDYFRSSLLLLLDLLVFAPLGSGALSAPRLVKQE